MIKYFGYNAPFIGGQENILSRQEGERLIKNDLVQLLLTAPDERVMRPDFGTRIRTFVFDNMDEQSLDELENDIREAISTYERRVQVREVVLNSDDSRNLLEIKIYGYFKLDKFTPDEAEELFDPSGNPGNYDLLVELDIPTARLETAR